MGIKAAFARHILGRLPEGIARRVRRAYYGRLLRVYPESNIPEFAVISELLRPGDLVIDVGANIGVFTKHLSLRVGPSGRVHSIEPIPDTCDVLRANVRKLGLSNVTVSECAVSDAEGTVTMQIPRFPKAAENYYRAHIVKGESDPSLLQVMVQTTTLDALLADRRKDVAFIKCDIEGHELPAMKGAGGILATAQPPIFLEVSGNPDKPGSSAQAVVNLLDHAGYRAFRFDSHRPGLVLRRTGDREINYFFLAETHRHVLRKRGLLPSDNTAGR